MKNLIFSLLFIPALVNAQQVDFELGAQEYAISRVQRSMSMMEAIGTLQDNSCVRARALEQIPQDVFCQLGQPNVNLSEKLKRVERFCQNAQVRPDTIYTNINNDRALIHILNSSDLTEIVNDSSIFPEAFYKLRDESPCRFTFDKAACFKKQKEELLNSQVHQRVAYFDLEYSYNSLPAPKLESCKKELTNQSWMDFSDPISESSATKLCQWIEQKTKRRMVFNEALYSEEKINKVNRITREVGWTILNQIQSMNISQRTKQRIEKRARQIISSERPSDDWIQARGANGQAIFNSNGTRQIHYSPYHMALLDIPDGEQFLWMITAHEIGHLILMEDGEIQNDLLLERSDNRSMLSCVKDMFQLENYPQYNQAMLAESASDVMAHLALSQGPANIVSPEDWQGFTRKSLAIFCEVNTAKLPPTMDSEVALRHYREEDHHPLVWDRIYNYFRNNTLRKNLGCEPLEEDYLCGFSPKDLE